jgi:hypothetical protein
MLYPAPVNLGQNGRERLEVGVNIADDSEHAERPLSGTGRPLANNQ